MPTDEVSPSAGGGGGDANGRRWAPHGQALTACLVALNVLVVLLIYYYFWRFFSGKGAAADDDDAGSSAASSPAASPKAQNRQEVERAITALPVFVHSSSSSSGLADGGGGGGGKAAVECAICIAEFGDGEEGRLLPRCGHRFHARCVDMWFHFHTTCPLCRASVLPAAAAAAEPEGQPSETNYTDMDCPV